jgi:hypothetical protein
MFKINIAIMKKIKSLLILGAMLLIGFAGLAQSITYRFNNYHVVQATGPDTLIFDVEAKCNVATTYTTTFTIKINFSATAFGNNAVPVVVQQLPLSQPTGYNFNTPATSVNASRFASTFMANRLMAPFSGTYQTAYLSNLGTSYQGVARYKMLITGTGNLGVEFYISGAGSMQTGQNYVLTSGGTTTTNYSAVAADNNLLNLPPDPTNLSLLISEVGDPSNSSTNFVELYNAGASSVNFSVYPWYLNFGGVSSVQLTGTLAAGGKYTVAYDNVDFTPNLVTTLVGTSGATTYLLTIFGNYVGGTPIDIYDAGAPGFNFSGKHAVRLYSIVNPNTTMTSSEWTLSPAQTIDMTPGSHHSTLTWDGVPDSEWRSRNNWAEGFIPDAGHNVSIPNVGAIPTVSYNDNAYANDLTIDGSGARLIIDSDQANGDGSIITYGTVSGTASVKRFLAADRYWYVTQPVTSATANVFLHTWMFTYNEPSGAWAPFIEDETTPLTIMKGYAVWTSSVNPWHSGWQPMGDTTTAYEGTLNSGAISTSLTATGGPGWNFTGNPYPSAVDWESSGWTKTNLVTNSYAVWNGSTYATYTHGGGSTNGGTRYISAAQGFFVQAMNNGTLGVTNSVRVHSSQSFWKSDETFANRLSLTISNGVLQDETVVYFNEQATSDLDYEYDATKLIAEASPQLFTMLGNSMMAINTYNNPVQTPKVTLGVNIPEAGDYTISATNIESFDASTPIYLEDLLTGQKIDLRQMSTYGFNAGEGSSERFAIHFAEYQGIGDDITADVNNIFSADNLIYVDLKATRGLITIYNILGQEVSSLTASYGINKISVPQGNTVYIVKVISDNNTVTKKVFVK